MVTQHRDIAGALAAIGFVTCLIVGTLPGLVTHSRIRPGRAGAFPARSPTTNARSVAPVRASTVEFGSTGRTAVGSPDCLPVAWRDLLDYVHWRESRYGADPRSRPGVVGPAGERGEFQVTPGFCRDHTRLTGQELDPYNNSQCRYAIIIWLSYYAPRVRARTLADQYELYRRGPTGFRRWRERR